MLKIEKIRLTLLDLSYIYICICLTERFAGGGRRYGIHDNDDDHVLYIELLPGGLGTAVELQEVHVRAEPGRRQHDVQEPVAIRLLLVVLDDTGHVSTDV